MSPIFVRKTAAPFPHPPLNMPISDKDNRLLQRLIDQAQPQSIEELQALLNSLVGAPLPDIPEAEQTPEDKAFDLADAAWQSSSLAKGKKMAEQALEWWPDCIPAYEYLAVAAKSKQARMEWLEKAVAIGQRLFGGAFLKEYEGHFWGITQTRPYMRCLNSLAQACADSGSLSKAIVIWEDCLRLNPGDNQGIRYSLLSALLLQNDLKAYHHYRSQYPEDSTFMLFNDVLASVLGNDLETGRMTLKAAHQKNPYVIPLLIDKAPPAQYPDSYVLGNPEEAVIYAKKTWALWRAVPGAIEMLQDMCNQAKPPRRPALPLLELPQNSLLLLINSPYSPISPLKLLDDLTEEDVAHLPFLQLARELLAHIQREQPLKLTAKGNLSRATLRSLYDLRFFPNEYIDAGKMKLLHEDHFPPLVVAHVLGEISGWMKKKNGKLSLTKKGSQTLEGPLPALYLELLKTYTMRYNWGYTEGWSYGVEETGHLGWAMIVYELLRQGDTEQSENYYLEQYLQIFPNLLGRYPVSEYVSPMERVKLQFRHRFFYNFGQKFGLVDVVKTIQDKHGLEREIFVRRTKLAERLFQI